MVNKETQLQTTNLEKKYFIRKNDLKTYKNKELKEPNPVHSLFLKNAHAI
jgi:hypothetical protein